MAKASLVICLLALIVAAQADDYYYKLGHSLFHKAHTLVNSYTPDHHDNSQEKASPYYAPEEDKPSYNKEVAVEGFVYCQYGYEKKPLEGAIVGAGCSKSNAFVEAKTNSYGYFYIPLNYGTYMEVNPDNYQVFLVSSPDQTCNIKTNIGKGKTGAPLVNSKSYQDRTLYQVGPFAFAPADNSYSSPPPEYKSPVY